MNFENQESAKSETTLELNKEARWQRQATEIDQATDALGEKIDPKIKETIIALNVLGFPTNASCEGHVDHGVATPWVEISAPGEPEFRYENEKGIFEEIATKHGCSYEDARRGIYFPAWSEAVILLGEKGIETTEYRAWFAETEKLREELGMLVEEFSREQSTPNKTGIIIGSLDGRIRIRADEEISAPEKMTDEERQTLAKRLTSSQAKMQKFAEFLKQKFFN